MPLSNLNSPMISSLEAIETQSYFGVGATSNVENFNAVQGFSNTDTVGFAGLNYFENPTILGYVDNKLIVAEHDDISIMYSFDDSSDGVGLSLVGYGQEISSVCVRAIRSDGDSFLSENQFLVMANEGSEYVLYKMEITGDVVTPVYDDNTGIDPSDLPNGAETAFFYDGNNGRIICSNLNDEVLLYSVVLGTTEVLPIDSGMFLFAVNEDSFFTYTPAGTIIKQYSLDGVYIKEFDITGTADSLTYIPGGANNQFLFCVTSIDSACSFFDTPEYVITRVNISTDNLFTFGNVGCYSLTNELILY